ncbi:MAG TPA: hypothetical protein VKU41_16110 [Polyangiaceae bacterium]|nr:hypothetical protein [Polyangiaceae bacterium]
MPGSAGGAGGGVEGADEAEALGGSSYSGGGRFAGRRGWAQPVSVAARVQAAPVTVLPFTATS